MRLRQVCGWAMVTVKAYMLIVTNISLFSYFCFFFFKVVYYIKIHSRYIDAKLKKIVKMVICMKTKKQVFRQRRQTKLIAIVD